MSAIFAGTCDTCGKEFWYSFGHPNWWKSQKGEIWEKWKALLETRTCTVCGSPEWDALIGKKEGTDEKEINDG